MKELNSKYYNTIYQKNKKNDGQYVLPPIKSVYANVWLNALKKIDSDDVIADFGCGPGQFIRLLIKGGFNFSYGIDFSSQAIKMARSLNKKYKERFYIKNLYDDIFELHPYNTAVCFEVLEHVTKDLSIIQKIPSETKFIFSVPNFWSKGHVRVFESPQDIKDRYKELIDIKEIYPIKMSEKNIIWLVDSVKI